MKRLFVLCFAVMAALCLVAKPVDAKKATERKAPFAKPAVTASTFAVVPQQHGTKRSTTAWTMKNVNANALAETSTAWVRNKGVAKAPTMQGDTLVLHLADLPYSGKMTMWGAPIILIVDKDTTLGMSASSEVMYTGQFGVFGSTAIYGNYGVSFFSVSKEDTISFTSDYNYSNGCAWAGELFDVKIDFATNYTMLTLENATIDTITVPYSVQGTVPTSTKYHNFSGTAVPVAHVYCFKAPADTTYTIISDGTIINMEDGNILYSGSYTLAKDSVMTLAIAISQSNYIFSVKLGSWTYIDNMQSYGTKYDEITLPYDATNVKSKYHENFGMYYGGFHFTVTDSVLLQSEISASSWAILDALTGTTITSDTLAAGEYVVEVMNSDAFTFDIHLATKPLDFVQDLSSYKDFDFLPLTLNKAEYGEVSNFDYSLMGRNIAGYKIHLKPGFYQMITTYLDANKGEINGYEDVLTSDSLTGDFGQDELFYSMFTIENKKEYADTLLFQIEKEGDYPMLIAPGKTSFAIDYKVLVTEYQITGYTAKKLDFSDKGTLTSADVIKFDGAYYYRNGYIVTVDAPTLVQVDFNNKNYPEQYLIYAQVPIEMDRSLNRFYVDYEGTTYLTLQPGDNYLTYLAVYGMGDVTYDMSFKKAGKLVSDTISIDSLLHIATHITSLPLKAQVTLGTEPSHLVAGRSGYFRNSGSAYYAMAYKMTVDSGKHLTLGEISNDVDNYVLVYKQCADTIVRVIAEDDATEIDYQSDSTTTYYFVFTTYYDIEAGLVDIKVDLSTITPITIQQLLAATTETVESVSTTDHFDADHATLVAGDGDFRNNGYFYYAFAYKFALDSAQTMVVKSDENIDDYLYIYKQYADTIKIVANHDDNYPYTFTADSTTTYYFVHTTYSSNKTGDVAISILDASASYANLKSLLAQALPFPNQTDTMTVNLTDFYQSVGGYAVAYKVDLDSAQLAYVQSYSWASSVCYKLDGDTIVEYNNRNSHNYIYADSATTYYFVIVSDEAIEELIFYSVSVDANSLIQSAQQADMLYINRTTPSSLLSMSMLEVDHDIESYYYLAQSAKFNLKKGDVVAANVGYNKIVYSNKNDLYGVLIRDVDSVAVLTLQDYAENLTDTVTIAQDGTYTFITAVRNVYEDEVISALNKVAPGINTFFAEKTLSAQNVQLQGEGISTLDDVWVLYAGTAIYPAYGYYFEVKSTDILNVNVDNDTTLAASVYLYKRNADSTYTYVDSYDDLTSREFIISGLNESDEYAIIVMFKSFDIYENIVNYVTNTDEYNVSIANVIRKTKVTSVAADVEYVSCEDNAMFITTALEGVQITAQTADGNEIVVENVVANWVINADSTEATYKVVTLPKGYEFAEDAVDSVVILFNPAIVRAIAGDHGSVAPASERVVRRGTSLTFSIEADKGYVIDAITINGTPVSSDLLNKRSGEYTYKATASATIEITFKATTEVRETELTNAVVYSRERTIYVDGAELNADVRIFSISGTMIYVGRIGADIESYTMPAAGMYIIRIADKVEKVMVK